MFGYAIVIALLAAVLRSAWLKGMFGEFIVNVLAKLFLNKEEYHLIKNVTLPTEDGTTQVDHIIVSKYGIFVIETKNMKGWIFGSPHEKTWTQKIYKKTHSFMNPLHQNYKHVKTLEACLGVEEGKIHPVVVFIGDSDFKTEMPDNVTQAFQYIRYIKSKKKVVFSNSEVVDILRKIESGRLAPTLKTHFGHVQHVQSIVNEKRNGNLCPRCGKPMMLRVARKGDNEGQQFWGCSGFPRCRGTAPVLQPANH